MMTLKKQIAGASAICSGLSKCTHSASRAVDESLAQTPNSNTGLNSQVGFTVGLDWLDITFRKVPTLTEVYDIVGEVEVLTDDEIDFSPTKPVFNGKEWQGSGRGLRGTQVFYDAGCDDDDKPSRTPALKVAMSGRVVGSAAQGAIALWLNDRAERNDLDCTRIDISMDDHEKFVNLGKITDAKRAGDFFNTSWSAYMESGKRGHDIGITVYFGSPKSDKRLRVYDKTVESNSKVVGNRWEAEFRRKAAKVALYQWIEANQKDEETVVQWCKDTVTGVVDFRDRSSGDPNRFRCPILGWFASLIKRLQAAPCRIRSPKPVITVQKSIDWVVTSVAPTLSMLKTVLKGDYNRFIEESIHEGACRLSIVKRKLIESTDSTQLAF